MNQSAQSEHTESINTVIFDLDGTLVEHGHVLMPPLLESWGFPRTLDEINASVEAQLSWVYGETINAGQWTKEIVTEWQRRILAGLAIPDPDGKRNEEVLAFFRTNPVPPLFEDVSTLLNHLADEGYSLGIITQRGRKGAEKFLGEHNILHHFDTLVCGDDGYGRKPTPQPFSAALDQLKSLSSQAVFIGDRIDDDCQGALGAGLGAFLIDRVGRHRQEIQEYDEITYLTSLIQLPEHI
ncbi:MAG: HAD family hydrolase [Chloroflexota bacterium]